VLEPGVRTWRVRTWASYPRTWSFTTLSGRLMLDVGFKLELLRDVQSALREGNVVVRQHHGHRSLNPTAGREEEEEAEKDAGGGRKG
jgi:hypothetical protein